MPEWAHIDASRRRLAADGEPSPTESKFSIPRATLPRQFSLAVRTDLGIVVGPACYRCAEFAVGSMRAVDMRDPDWHSAGVESTARLRSRIAARVHLSRDPTTHAPN